MLNLKYPGQVFRIGDFSLSQKNTASLKM